MILRVEKLHLDTNSKSDRTGLILGAALVALAFYVAWSVGLSVDLGLSYKGSPAAVSIALHNKRGEQ